MIKAALLIITMAGHGVVYENHYPSMETCIADKNVVLEQAKNFTVDVLCVPHTDNSDEIFRLFNNLIERIEPEGKCGGIKSWEQNTNHGSWNQTKTLCSND